MHAMRSSNESGFLGVECCVSEPVRLSVVRRTVWRIAPTGSDGAGEYLW